MELVNPLLVNGIAIVAIVVGLALSAWWTISLYWMHSRREEDRLSDISLPEGIHERMAGIPPALIIFYIFMICSMVGYILYIWLGGISY